MRHFRLPLVPPHERQALKRQDVAGGTLVHRFCMDYIHVVMAFTGKQNFEVAESIVDRVTEQGHGSNRRWWAALSREIRRRTRQ